MSSSPDRNCVERERGDRGRLAYNHYIRLFVFQSRLYQCYQVLFIAKSANFCSQSATLNVKQVVQLMYKSAILAHLIHQNWRIKSPHLVALVSIWTYAQRERRTIISRYSLSPPLSLSYFSSVQIFIVDCGGAVTAATNYILHVFVFAFSSLDQHFGKQRYIYQETVFI